MGVYMYSQTCIERSPSGDSFPQNRGNIKNDENAILCHNWSLYVQNLVKKILTLISGEKHG